MKKFLASVCFWLAAFLLPAQVNDAGLWTGLAAEKKISQSLSASFSQTFRFNENISELGNYFSEVGIDRKIVKGISLGASYRYINKRELNDSYSVKHRYFIGLSLKKKLAGISLSFRTRLQSQLDHYFLPSEKLYGNTPQNYWRNKISLSYVPSKKYKPFISAELWHPFYNPDALVFDNLRCSAGTQYDINKKNSLETEFIFQKELGQKNPETDFIFSINYTFAF